MFNILKGALEVAAKKDIRFYLNAVHVVRDGSELRIESTDGHCAYRATIEIIDNECGVDDGSDVLICRDSLTQVLKMFKKNDKVPLVVTGGEASVNGMKLTLIDGRFPAIQRIIDAKQGDTVDTIGVGIPALETVMKSFKAALASEKFAGVKMSQGDGVKCIRFNAETKHFKLLIIQMPARV